MAGLPLSQAIEEYLAWLELDRHASTGTVAGYRGDLQRFAEFAGGDAGIPDIAELALYSRTCPQPPGRNELGLC
jgi:site-specific recombinase XerD